VVRGKPDRSQPRRTKAEIQAEIDAENAKRASEAEVIRARSAARSKLIQKQQLLAEAEEARRVGDLGTCVQKVREANEL
jgi:predicted Zn-dependent peptidase